MIDSFSEALQTDGLVSALRHLNRTVAHRYTAISLIDGLDFFSAGLVDKAGQEMPATFSFTPVHASFCQFTVRDGQFATDNSALDRRLDGLPYQGIVVAYHAVRLVNAQGEHIGALSHFDHVVRSITAAQLALLGQAAAQLAGYAGFAARPA